VKDLSGRTIMADNIPMTGKIRASEVTRFLDAWFSVRQFIQASNFNRFQGAGLSATQFMTLNVLPDAGEGISMGELARHMNLNPATVAKTVDSLEARKLLERVRSDADKRMVMVRLTSAGTELQNAASEQFRENIRELLKALLPNERAGLIAGLEAFVRAAGGETRRRGHRAIPGNDAAPGSRSGRLDRPH